MNPFTHAVIEVIGRIPHGKVTTYGLIAAAAGNHCGARQVARILYSSSDKYELPWHRVVNREGKISPRSSMSHIDQRTRLEREGVRFDAYERIDFDTYLWIPNLSETNEENP